MRQRIGTHRRVKVAAIFLGLFTLTVSVVVLAMFRTTGANVQFSLVKLRLAVERMPMSRK
jgi:hypothetical protein